MSSPSRPWSEPLAALFAAVLLPVFPLAPAAPAVVRLATATAATAVARLPAVTAAVVAPLPIDAELSGAGKTTLLVDLSAAPAGTARTVAVNLDGTPRPAELTPVVSPDLVVSMVVDASAAGAASLPSWLSAGARFSLAAPSQARTVVIADREPATVTAGPLRGPAGVVRALGTVRPGGARDTAAALTLAAQQFPGTPAGRRVTLLYTTAVGIDGLSASRLADRFRATGTLLVVVGTADPDRYWSSATAGTGGFFAPAGDPVVVSALDQVETTLSGRSLVRFDTPPRLPARVSVSVRAGDVILAGETAIGAPPPAAAVRVRAYLLLAGAGVLLVVFVLLLVVLLRRRRARVAVVAPASPYAVLLGGPALPGRSVAAAPASSSDSVAAGPAVSADDSAAAGPVAPPDGSAAARPVSGGSATADPVVSPGGVMRPPARGRAAIPTSDDPDE